VAGLIGSPAFAGANDSLPNNFPFFDATGTAATFSTAGAVDLGNEFHTPQGTNGRSCATCHQIETGWSIRPIDIELKFFLTQGKEPIFNPMDANNVAADVSTFAARFKAYSMLRRGLFRRNGDVPATAEFEITAVDDPLLAGGTLTHFEFFRRPLATANFHIAANVGWHDQNTNGSRDVHAGLIAQAAGNITGGQQGQPATATTLESIASYELGLNFAQQSVFGVGLLTACGGRGGPENLAAQPPLAARFDLYDSWIGLVPGSCGNKVADRKRAQIARGQEIFNSGSATANGRGCTGCHNAANNGSNIAGTLFDVHASDADVRSAGLPLYTLRNKTTGEVRQTSDPGRAVKSGKWADVSKFKVPSLRGLAARAPYFHNGIAPTLSEVVRHYEAKLNFQFSDQERQDLVAFLEAL
jgi:cytochrome c peroxidase